MRYLYSLLLYLALPFLFLRLLWRSRRFPAYRERLGERAGFYSFRLEKCIWLHTVSVGETLAAVPLIDALLVAYPNIPFVVTTMTPTGAAQVRAVFGDRVQHVYIPYDFPGAVNRFLDAIAPVVGLIMETELWPNLLTACQQRHIPVCLLNARLSERSANGYRRIASLSRAMLQSIFMIGAQGHADAKRFIELGALPNQVVVTGNIKFDVPIPAEINQQGQLLRQQLGAHRFIWIAASTHAGEEEHVLAAHLALLKKNKDALLILVPRHPGRFNAVAELVQKTGLNAVRRSYQAQPTETTQVYIGDTMGELLLLYAASDAAFLGGSLVPHGGHNMLEAAALGKPVLTGPHVFNFAEITDLLVAANALTITEKPEALYQALNLLMTDVAARKQLGLRAQAVVDANRGVLVKQLAIVKKILR